MDTVHVWDHVKKQWGEPIASGEREELSDLDAFALMESYAQSTIVKVQDGEYPNDYKLYFKGRQEVDNW